MDPLLVTNYLYISLFSSLSLGDWLNSSLPILLFGDNFYLDILRVLISIDLFICQGYHYRSSHQRCSMKKGVLRNFQNSQEDTCVRVSFLIKLQGEEHLFYRTPLDDCFCHCKHWSLLLSKRWDPASVCLFNIN